MQNKSESKLKRHKTERKTLKSLGEVEALNINEFIIRYNGTPFHEIPFNKIASEYFGTEAIIVIVYGSDNLVIGTCIIHYRQKGLLREGFSGLCNHEVPYGGWIFNQDKISLAELMPLTRGKWNEKIYYYSNICFEEEPYYIRNSFGELATAVVDLSKDIDEYFETEINSHTRNKIRKARKSGVITRYFGLDELDKFNMLSDELKKRVGMRNEFEFYKRIFEYYHTQNRCTLIAEEFENEIISAGIMLANPNVSIGWVAARKTEIPNNLYQNELLLWDSIIWSRDRNCRFFDLSGLDEIKLPHLARIKLSISKDIRYFYSKTLQNISVRIINRLQTGK